MDDPAATNSDPPQPSPPQQTQSKLSSTRRRRHSIATSVVVPTRLSFSAAAAAATTTKPLQSFNTFPHHQNGTVSRPPPLDYDEILSLKCSPPETYTSLKDILPVSAAVSSPTTASAAAVSSGYEISIRNRLVKQAAWAYLQPMSSSPGSSGPHFLHRLWLSFLSFFKRHVVPGFSYLLHQVLRACDCR
uniref:Uncharacterized protein n=1 Tax=Quercus lobata TaxID=97700 RepID=A0A7N2M548_QUELO